MKALVWFLFAVFASLFLNGWALVLTASLIMAMFGITGAGMTAIVGLVWLVGVAVATVGAPD